MTDWGKAYAYGKFAQLSNSSLSETSRTFSAYDSTLIVSTGHDVYALPLRSLLFRADDMDWHSKVREQAQAEVKALRRSNAALRGQITKLRKRLEEK